MINERYKIKKRLGTGRSQIYLCSDIYNPSKDFAIKILPFSENAKELKSFRNQYFLLKKLDHPNIVKTYEYGTVLTTDQHDVFDSELSEGSKFFTMDYLPGITLDKFDERNDIKILESTIEQISSVLFYLHQSNFIYYNLNPANILVHFENGKYSITIFDFSLTKYLPDNEPFEVQGTANYIAPEILLLENVDHRADLYSFGVLLYLLIYGRFPFDTENELIIYKANIESKFEFPSKSGYEAFINITKKLLQKSPEDRYKTSLEILEELKIPISNHLKNYWTPIKLLCGRRELLYDINSQIYNNNSQKVIVIMGEEGSGKSILLDEINYIYSNSILIKSSDINSIYPLWKVLLYNIFYSEMIYKNLEIELRNEIYKLQLNDSFDFIDKLKSIFLRISRNNKFELLIDDFSKYDLFSIEIFQELIPIFQVNGIKIVLADENELSILSDMINDFKTYYLIPFNDDNFNEFFEKSYFKFFPKKNLKDFVKQYSDFLPGNIYGFIKNILFLNILKYDYQKIQISKTPDALIKIDEQENEIFEIRIKDLSDDELIIVNLISLFNIQLDLKIISLLCGISENTAANIIDKLRYKGIFYNSNVSLNPKFSSRRLKKYVYENISDKKYLHAMTAASIIELFPEFNKIETARQFELAGNYKKCFELLKEELNIAGNKLAVSYQRKILNKLLSFPLDNDDLLEVKHLLSNTLLLLGEFKICLKLTDELLDNNKDEAKNIELFIQKGKALIKLKLFEDGIKILEQIISEIENETQKQSVLIEIADAELYLNNFDKVNSICRNVIEEKQSGDETKAKAYSLLGLVELNKSSNLAGAIYNFKYASNIYQKAGLLYNVAGMELNIGNIINIKGNLNEAKKHWHESFIINESIGNLEHEAKLVMNYGVYYFQIQHFEKSIQQYKRAENIFSSLGFKHERGLVLINLGEVYLNICEYENSLSSLEQAQKIFNQLKNKEEESELLFLFGQCYFNLGDTENLIKTINLFENRGDDNDLSCKDKKYVRYLQQLGLFLNKDWHNFIEGIKIVMNDFLNENERESSYYFSKCNTMLIRALLNTGDFDSAIRQLNEKNFLKLCDQYVVFKAEREYLFGLVAEQNKKFNIGPPVDFYNKAIQLVEERCILELTWEINFSLAKYYFTQGNFKRFIEYSGITKSLLNFISKKINSKSIREIYLNSLNRGSSREILDNFEKSLK
ncbi:MAG: protein kinase [Bacteroidetes bacterium]|nr:protein kinase [Bacteroidota bacterium]